MTKRRWRKIAAGIVLLPFLPGVLLAFVAIAPFIILGSLFTWAANELEVFGD